MPVRQVQPETGWPESWKTSYAFDLLEVYGPRSANLGYAYAYESRRRHTLALLSDGVPAGARVLDVAAAQGNFSLPLAELGYRVTWNDLREELAGYVRLKHDHGEVSFAPGNAFELHFEAPFDAVLITEVIEHVAHPDEFLRSAAALVKPGGAIVLTTPNGAYFKNPLPRFSDCPDPSVFESVQFKPDSDGHIFLLYEDEIRRFAREAGLVVEDLRYFTTPLTNGHLKTARLLALMPKSWVFALERIAQWLPSFVGRKVLLQLGVRLRKVN